MTWPAARGGPHWIAANESTRLPRRHIVIDTEAWQTELRGGRVQTFRLACAAFDHQPRKGRPWAATELARFTDPAGLWGWVDERCLADRRTVVVAHNLAYDLRVGDVFTHLPALGWSLAMIRLDGGQTWCQWRDGARSLTMVDTVSWFGCPLDRLGLLLRMPKLELPGWDAPDDEWFARCAQDVEILRVAWRSVLEWIEADDHGTFKPTGAGQGWASYRHNHYTDRVLHHGQAGIAAVEREAAWAGRCEAWRWGDLPAGEWVEWDFASAYARVARDHAVPVRLRGPLSATAAQRALEGGGEGAALIRCRVDQPAPVAPCRGSHGILWPVGSFTSWLWDIEAREVLAAGGTVAASEGWSYATAPALRQWALWVLEVLDGFGAGVDPLVRQVVKGWSRTVVGRFGSRWSSWDDAGPAHGESVVVRVEHLADEARHRRVMMVGGRALAEGVSVDAPDSATHVMSFVMAATRVRLWRVMLAAGLENVAYVDTDAVLVNEAGSARLERLGIDGLRPKSRWSRVHVLAPRQLILGGGLRAAGIPRRAARVGSHTWEAEVWRSLAASLRNGEPDRVALRDRRFVLAGRDRRRRHEAGGLTAPLELGLPGSVIDL